MPPAFTIGLVPSGCSINASPLERGGLEANHCHLREPRDARPGGRSGPPAWAAPHLEYYGRHREDHGFVEHWVRVSPLHGRLLFAHLPPILKQVHLDEGVCGRARGGGQGQGHVPLAEGPVLVARWLHMRQTFIAATISCRPAIGPLFLSYFTDEKTEARARVRKRAGLWAQAARLLAPARAPHPWRSAESADPPLLIL